MKLYQIILWASEQSAVSAGGIDFVIKNVGYALIVIAFGIGLWFVNRWGNKIKADDEEMIKKYEENLKEQMEEEKATTTEESGEDNVEKQED